LSGTLSGILRANFCEPELKTVLFGSLIVTSTYKCLLINKQTSRWRRVDYEDDLKKLLLRADRNAEKEAA